MGDLPSLMTFRSVDLLSAGHKTVGTRLLFYLPGRILTGQHPPGAAAPHQVEDGVRRAPGGQLGRATTSLRGARSGSNKAHSASERSVG